ncbi:MAG: enoyl-CoA hydratase [Candidatus Dadabacteria bacterium]|nr:MAG: enoyl-CoA hydratase [Candidatus Dadabacteria bacterium]
MNQGRVIERLEDQVLWLEIDNPERRNAVNPAMLDALSAMIERVDQAQVRCIVLTGAGDRAFCSGYDLSGLPEQGDGDTFAGAEALRRACDALMAAPVPVIAALQGACFGAGGELAVSCDLRYAADSLKMAMPPARLGIIYDEAGLARFAQVVGDAAARELFFRGRPVDAVWADRNRFVQGVFPAAELHEAVDAIAREIASNAPLAIRGMKAILDAARTTQFSEQEHVRFRQLRRSAFASEDYREGVAAMQEKRAPEFRGR